MIKSLLAFAFILLGFVLIGSTFVAFPFLLIVVVPFVAYKLIKWGQQKQQDKLKPNYQNGGIMPQGVDEDRTNEPLSFQPKH